MTKHEYLQLKMRNSLEIAYEYYKEKFDSNKHKSFLGAQEFMVFLQMHMNVPRVFEKVCRYYDDKFTVVELKDKNGQLLGFL